MQVPPTWTEQQIISEAATARGLFRAERLVEPLERWQRTIARYRDAFERLFTQFNVADIATLTPEQIATIFATKLTELPPLRRGVRRTPEEKKLAKENLSAALVV